MREIESLRGELESQRREYKSEMEEKSREIGVYKRVMREREEGH